VKRRRKSWIKVKQVKNYVVGEDIAWDSVLQMAKLTLVGRVMGRNFSRKTVADWVEGNWKPLLGYAPVVVMLNRGWFAFKFIKEEELRRVLNMNWHLNHSPVLLKPWHPLFDASRERVDVIPIWVRMPALPLHFWELQHFKRIGDILGTFLEADLTYLETLEQKIARILVSINIREGLAEQINLEWGPEIIPQILDYEKVSFRCRRCHAYGHPSSECSLPASTNSGGRRTHFKGSKGSTSEKGSGSSDFVPSSSDDPGSKPAGDEPSLVCPEAEENPAAQMVLVPVPQR